MTINKSMIQQESVYTGREIVFDPIGSWSQASQEMFIIFCNIMITMLLYTATNSNNDKNKNNTILIIC